MKHLFLFASINMAQGGVLYTKSEQTSLAVLLYYFNQSFIAIYFQVDSLIKSVTIPQRISPFMFISLKRLTHAFVDNPPS